MRVFISGGCKNGKSTYAERVACMQQQEGLPLYYLATMIASDNEDLERIARHQRQREGLGFITMEQPRDIIDISACCDLKGSFLLDSTTALLANEMFLTEGVVNEEAYLKVANHLDSLLNQIENIVIVSDYIYSDASGFDSLTNGYRKGLAYIDRGLAERCDVVIEVSFGSLIYYKCNSHCHGSTHDRLVL